MAKRVKKPKNLYYNVFINEYVEIVTKQMIDFTEQKEDSVQSTKTPLTFSGIVIDIDEQNVYLGNEDGITTSVARSDIMATLISEPEKEGLPEVKEANKELN